MSDIPDKMPFVTVYTARPDACNWETDHAHSTPILSHNQQSR